MRAFRPSTRTLVLALFCGLALPGAAQAQKPRVRVAPYAPLHHAWSVELGARTADLVREELVSQGRLEVVGEPLLGAAGTDRPEAPARAAQLAGEAETARKASELEIAAGLYAQALELYGEDPGAVDASAVVGLQFAFAEVLVQLGRQAEAETLLAQAVRLAPTREIDPTRHDAQFTRTFSVVRRDVLSRPRATLEVHTDPEGARVTLDGRALGRTPLVMTGLVPGTHYLQVEAPGAPARRRTLELAPGARETVTLAPAVQLEGPEAALVAALADNELGDDVLAAAAEVATAHDAQWVVFGAVRAAGDGYDVRSWIYEAGAGRLAALSEMRFDADLLTAAMEASRVAGDTFLATRKFPAVETVPVAVFPGAETPEVPAPTTVAVAPEAPTTGPLLPGAGPLAPVVEAAPAEEVEPAGDAVAGTEPEEAPEAPAEEAAAPVTPLAPLKPVGPVDPASGEAAAAPRREPTGPLAAGAIRLDAEDDEDAPAGEAAAAPAGPIGPVPLAPRKTDEETVEIEEQPREQQVASVGGDRERLEVEEGGANRYAAVDIEDIVFTADEVETEKGWPWWAWGLLTVGAIGLGAGGWYAAQEMGGESRKATVNIRW